MAMAAWALALAALAVCVSAVAELEPSVSLDSDSLLQTEASSRLSRCERESQKKSIYTRALARWAVKKVNPKLSPRGRQVANQIYIKLQRLAYSKRVRDAYVDKCQQDYFRRAIYRHEARFLVARAVLRGHKTMTRSFANLKRQITRTKCEKSMYRAVSPLWRDGGKKLKFSPDLCYRMLEEWKSKLEISTKAVRAIKKHRNCNVGLWKGHMKRAEYMVAGVKANCKGQFGRTAAKNQVRLRAGIKKGIAGYALNALASNGNERFQNSHSILITEPAYQRAQRLFQKRSLEYSQVANVGK